ncbi:T9SS type A sorting domain-containing protein [Paenimyroides aestuarii]|uniref:T9SS type A sorting domain-containing protein n=1 Tax=Paenimyroides aestuarii TaxID=2968490 RepID=A0ABY5NS79_9FLAO|nr:T9SS type A sorting domain-containing protein [Paenimyroides aestuarii]UUV21436.1 T9SS type A sorting domain-containing protein [Paenimyroides aestuarii]
MNRKILLAAVLLASISVHAQSFNNRASFWLKPNKTNNTAQMFNKNAAVNGNSNQSLTTSIGAGNSNFYMVFKSEDGIEKDLMNFTFTCAQHAVTTHNINYHDASTIDQKRRTGAIVKYGFNYPNATGDKNYVTIIDTPNDLTDVYEVIYVNDTFTELDHQQIQTYLSIKYGISLIDNANYVDANGKQIWNHQLNPAYNNTITGLGRSDYFGLNKLETVNSVDKRLAISSDGFANNEYLFVGSTNEKTNFVKENDTEILDSSWLVQTNKKPAVANLRFNLGTLKTTGTYQLAINPSATTFENDANVLRVEGKVQGNELVFENVVFDTDGNGYDTFSIVHTTQSKQTTKPEIVSNLDSKVNAYPNPASINETVNVTYNFGKPTNLNIHVFTLDGKLVSKKEVNNIESYVFDTTFSSNGVYLIVSTYNGEVTTNRIIVK